MKTIGTVGPVWFSAWFSTFFQNRIKRVSYHFITVLKCVLHVCQPYAIKILILKIFAISGFCKWTTYSFYNLWTVLNILLVGVFNGWHEYCCLLRKTSHDFWWKYLCKMIWNKCVFLYLLNFMAYITLFKSISWEKGFSVVLSCCILSKHFFILNYYLFNS